MTLDLQQLSDRVEIEQLVAGYAEAVDSRNWDALEALFTPTAAIDFSATGGPSGDLATVTAFLAEVLPGFRRTQHLMGPTQITFDGDRARARTPCHNPMVLDDQVWLIGLWYTDDLVRTPSGWRFAGRTQELCYVLRDLGRTS